MVRPYAEFRVPLYFEFPASMLRPGGNTVDVHAVSDRLGSWLAPFYLGPASELKPAFDYLHFVQVSLLAATIVALGVVSVLLLGLFWIRPCDTAHGWFAAATICWALYNWLTLEPRVLLPYARIWFALAHRLAGLVHDLLGVISSTGCRDAIGHGPSWSAPCWHSASPGSLLMLWHSARA